MQGSCLYRHFCSSVVNISCMHLVAASLRSLGKGALTSLLLHKNSVLSPDIFFCLVLILDFRVNKCLRLGWDVVLQVLGTWPEGSTKTKIHGINTICISGPCEGCGWGEWLAARRFWKYYIFLCWFEGRLAFNLFVEQLILELLWRCGYCTVVMHFGIFYEAGQEDSVQIFAMSNMG